MYFYEDYNFIAKIRWSIIFKFFKNGRPISLKNSNNKVNPVEYGIPTDKIL